MDYQNPVVSLPFSGNYNYNSGAVANVGSNGNFWSATSNSGPNAYNLNFNSNNLNPQNNNCVAQ